MTTTIHLPRSAPEAQGLPSSAILEFVAQAEQNVENLHSLMIVRRGHVVAEGWWAPYAAERPHMFFSLSKSFTSTAIGLAIAEGLLSLDDPVLSFFPADAPAEVSANLAAMQVRHLLGMSTGHADDTTPPLHQAADGNWARAFLACPVEHAPGTHFLYNTGATYMLAAILHKLTGVTLLEYLQPRLLTPLGIEGATWEMCPRGINTGGYGMSATTEAIANFGQLLLQEGMWQGEQLVPQAWVRMATQAHIANGDDPNSDWAQGYGYQFWRCRHNAYRGDGAFGQYCVVMPEQDAVIAITGGLDAMQPVLDLIWEHLLPACGPAPLPPDPAAHGALTQKLASLELPTPQGIRPMQNAKGEMQKAAPGVPMSVSVPAHAEYSTDTDLTPPEAAQAISGRSYRCESNELQISAFRLDVQANGCTLTIADADGEHRIAVGDGVWQPGMTAFTARGATVPIAAAGAWYDATTYVARIAYTEAPFVGTLTCRFAADRLLLDVGVNVSFGPTSYPQIVGMLA
jgi:CubicO group peptidase (beta-lactamase class C family)